MGKEELKEKLLKAFEEGNVHFVEVNVDADETVEFVPDPFEEAKREAEHIAKLNRILYEAHVKVGFDVCDALELTVAVIKAK